MDYSVDVATAGSYTISTRLASGGSGGAFHFEFDGVDESGPITAQGTGGWQTWVNVDAVVTLAAGQQLMRFYSDNGGINVKEFNITSGGTPPPPTGVDVYVESIVLSTVTGGGNRTHAEAVITIKDDTGALVSGANVSGQWSGLTSDADTGTTDGAGQVTLASGKVRNANGSYVITVTDVTGSGITYNPSLNVETSDSITHP